MRRTLALGSVLAILAVVPIAAQSPTITLGTVPCLPVDGNGVVTATVSPDQGSLSVRLYFRRMSLEVEDFYFTEMKPSGAGGYWGIFPDPEDQAAKKKDLKGESEEAWAKWWQAKEASEGRDPNDDLDDNVIKERAALGKLEKRAWMTPKANAELQKWLEALQNEPAEYFVAIYDTSGRLLVKSEQRVVEVKKKDCSVTLTPQQQGYAQNLTVGETREWQKGESVFHWECDGLVTRIDTVGVMRPDNACRACIIAWWANPAVAGPASLAFITGITVYKIDPEPASPSRP